MTGLPPVSGRAGRRPWSTLWARCGHRGASPSRRAGAGFMREPPAQRNETKEKSNGCAVAEFRCGMYSRQRLATPVFAQSAAPAAGSANSGKERGASIPDISGIWVHPSIPGFEPLPSGPDFGGQPVAAANGVGQHQPAGRRLHQSDLEAPGRGSREKARRNLADRRSAIRTRATSVGPAGVPFVFTSGGMQLLQQPDKITILYDYDHQVRHVRMNQPHPARGDAVLVWGFRRPLRRRHAGHRHGGVQGRALFHGRLVWHATHPGPARGRTISAARLRSRERRHGTGRQGESSRPGDQGPELSGQVPAAPIHGRG